MTRIDVVTIAGVTLTLAAVAAYIAWRGDALYGYGDSVSHSYIARRILDSKTPGFAQIGTNWLPALHFVLIPFINIPFIREQGLAGAMVEVPLSALSAVAMAYTVTVITGRRSAGMVAAAVMVFNPSYLYLHTTAMTEGLGIAALTVTAAAFTRWMRDGGSGSAALLGVAAAAGVWVRYDGWMTVAGVTLAAMLWSVAEDPHDHERPEAIGISVAAPGALSGMLWLFYNWTIFGSPLFFATSEYSANFIGRTFVEAAGTKHHMLASIWSYTTACMLIAGMVMSIAAVVTFGLLLFLRRRDPYRWLLVLAVLLTPFVFNVVTIYGGSSAIFTPQTVGSYFNVRYGVLTLPAIAYLVGLFAGSATQRAIRGVVLAAACAVVIAQVGIFVHQGINGAAAVRDFRAGTVSGQVSNEQIRLAAEEWSRHYDGGTALIDVQAVPAPMQLFTLLATPPAHDYITLDNNELWNKALQDPVPYARWLIDPSGFAGRGGALRLVLSTQHVSESYRLVYQDALGIRFYRLKSAQ